MSDLAQQVFEDWVKEFDEAIIQSLIRWKPPIRKANGMRARKRALYWRGK